MAGNDGLDQSGLGVGTLNAVGLLLKGQEEELSPGDHYGS